jgi:hypothetical protein
MAICWKGGCGGSKAEIINPFIFYEVYTVLGHIGDTDRGQQMLANQLTRIHVTFFILPYVNPGRTEKLKASALKLRVVRSRLPRPTSYMLSGLTMHLPHLLLCRCKLTGATHKDAG